MTFRWTDDYGFNDYSGDINVLPGNSAFATGGIAPPVPFVMRLKANHPLTYFVGPSFGSSTDSFDLYATVERIQ
jgi:hypothetical protein